MYVSFEIENFRCFQKFSVSGFERINLITGKNNVGKTALLEAFFLHCGAYNPVLTMTIRGFRGIDKFKISLGRESVSLWADLFNNFDISKNVELIGEDETGEKRSLRLKAVRGFLEPQKGMGFLSEKSQVPTQEIENVSSEPVPQLELTYKERNRRDSYRLSIGPDGISSNPVPPPPPFPGFFLGSRMRISPQEDSERFGKLDKSNKQDLLLDVLKIIEPRINRIAVVVEGGIPMLQGDIGVGRLMPLVFMGEGMARLTSLFLEISNANNGVVLVDEIDSGLHHSILTKTWTAIAKAARQFNVQVFATTHSLECVRAAYNSFLADGKNDFKLFRLEQEQEGAAIRPIAYDRESLAGAIEADLEIR